MMRVPDTAIAYPCLCRSLTIKSEYKFINNCIIFLSNGHLLCGGTLLSSDTVLTAAHCKKSYSDRIMVVVGEHDLSRSVYIYSIVWHDVSRKEGIL